MLLQVLALSLYVSFYYENDFCTCKFIHFSYYGWAIIYFVVIYVMEKMIIIGSGPAGHTAAVYAAQATLKPLMFEGFMAGGIAAGWQLTTTTLIENFPGFPHGIQGPDLMTNMREQSINLWVRIESKTVDKVDLSQRPFKVFVWSEVFEAESLIIATGATAIRLWLPGEERLWQKGISACAVCDGGLPMFRDKQMVIIWWWDAAIEEALYLTKFASKVIMLVRRDEFRASKAMQEKAFNSDKIEIMRNTQALELLWDDVLEQVRIKNNISWEESMLDVAGLFYAVGHRPNVEFLDGQLALQDSGHIETKAWTAQTSVEGVFAAGDVQDRVYRQAITSAGTGCMAALEAERFLG